MNSYLVCLKASYRIYTSIDRSKCIETCYTFGWLVQDEMSIQSSQGLDSLAALDPEVEYRTRLASSFKIHYRRFAEEASRSVFLSLHASSPHPQWVQVQKARGRTPADEASKAE